MKFGNFLLSFLIFGPLKLVRNRTRLLLRVLAVISVVLLVNFIAGCYYYKASTTSQPPKEELVSLTGLDKQFVVHTSQDHYFVQSLTFQGDSLELQLDSAYYQEGDDMTMVSPNAVKRYRKRKGEDARLLNEVHLYVTQKAELSDKVWMVPVTAIDRMDVYNHSSEATTTYSILFGLALIPGVFLAMMLIILLILLLSGSSCPFIYTWNGQEYEFAGEIYSGAVYPPLERHDYLLLSGLVEENGEYKLQIANELKEIQHTNLLELMVFDHESGKEVLVDKYGTAHTVSEPVPPIAATSLRGENLLPIVEKEDDLVYLGSDPSKDPPLLDGVVLTFQIPSGTKQADLVISAKNSYWLDFVYQNFRDMLGISYNMWMKKQQDGDPEHFESWSLSQNIPLSVYVMKDGTWEFCDYYHTVGPMAFKKDILELDLTGLDTDQLMIKLEAGSYFWEITYVGLDLDQAPVPAVKSISLSRAVDENGQSVLAQLLKDDEEYYHQPEIGNRATLNFPVPETSGDRTIFLHSKGHYDIVQDPEGVPKIKALKEIRKTGNFNKYSNQLMQEMLAEHTRVHGQE